jgi:glycine/D-amino acid oxidase-like deaminating enzyme
VPRPGLAGADRGALLCPDNGELDSAATVRALAAGAGRQPREGVVATAITEDAGGVTIGTGGGELRASAAVLATNAWAAELWPGAPVSPVRGQMVLTVPLDAEVADRPVYSDRGFRYWRQLPDGRLALGGWRNVAVEEEVGFDDEPTARIQDQLDGHLRTLAATRTCARGSPGTAWASPSRWRGSWSTTSPPAARCRPG